MKKELELEPGTVLDGRFEVLKLIKAGGMGAVYEAADKMVNRRICALKQMLDQSALPSERQTAIDRFLSEIQVMQTLNHPSIPHVYSSFVYESSFFFAMEFIEGHDLAHVLRHQGTPGLPAESVVSWALQTLDALNYIHNLTPAITHRDLKPSNLILRERDNRLMLIDFGIARVTNPSEGFWIGTPGYAPAEQQQGNPEPRSDIYALGATMHELLSGRKPKDWDFPVFEDLGVEVDRNLAAVVFKALGTWPDERFSSAEEMSNALKNLPGIYVSLPSACREHEFETAVIELRGRLYPLLQKLITRYSNECHTPYLPHNIDFFEFTLAAPTPFALQIVKDPATFCVRFYEKQGILEPMFMGEIKPMEPGGCEKVDAIVDRFVTDYEDFKNASWGLMM